MSAASAGGTPPLPTDDPPPGGAESEENFYSPTDLGPYEVYVESIEENNPVGGFHPMKLGKILHENNVTGIMSINKKGRNRIAVRLNSSTCANNLVLLKIRPESLKIYIPRHLTTCQGVIRNVDTSLSLEDIMNNVRSVRQVLKARRLNRRIKEGDEVKYEPTRTVVLTFKGCILPKTISLYYVPLEVSTYILPVVRCMNCLRFGHNTKACKSTTRCRNCGEPPHPDTTCSTKCIHCSGNHNALSPECPELKRQQDIKQLMAFDNITFFEAAKRFPRPQASNSTNDNFLHRPQLFPTITRSQIDSSPINSNYDHNRSPQSSYSNVTRAPGGTKKKRTLSPGYDRSEHNNLLWFPNGNASPTPNLSSPTLTANSPQTLDAQSSQSPSMSPINVLDPAQASQLKELLKSLPNPEQTFNSIYSFIAQIINYNLYNNGYYAPPMER